MSRSRKKVSSIVDHPKDAKKINNRKFRRRSKTAIVTDKELPIKNSEVMNDYDVSDYKFLYWPGEKDYKKNKRK